jgi:hypothetical protein
MYYKCILQSIFVEFEVEFEVDVKNKPAQYANESI